MRILHIATLVTPDGAYGGPIRVASNLIKAQINEGHEALLVAGSRGFAEKKPTEFDGAPVHLFDAHQRVPGVGFAGLASPALQRWLRRNVRSFDVVHIHLARDLVTLPAARTVRSSGVPYVIQTHGMIDKSANPLARPLDRFLTRPAAISASRVLHLTSFEKNALRAWHGGSLNYFQLQNGVELPALPGDSEREELEVLYLARLHVRKRPEFFARMAVDLAQDFPSAYFSLVGPDEGSMGVVQSIIEARSTADRVTVEGPLGPEKTLSRMRSAAVYVLPSVNEPFPMSVLEAMSLGKPVIVTRSCGLAPFIESSKAGLVVTEDQESLNEAVTRLLENTELRIEMGRNARKMVADHFSIDAISRKLTNEYRSILA